MASPVEHQDRRQVGRDTIHQRRERLGPALGPTSLHYEVIALVAEVLAYGRARELDLEVTLREAARIERHWWESAQEAALEAGAS